MGGIFCCIWCHRVGDRSGCGCLLVFVVTYLLRLLEVLVLLWAPVKQEGLASRFHPVERLNNGKLACTRERWRDPSLLLVASRTLPCGTLVLVESVRTGKSSLAQVMDFGPFGSICPDGSWQIKRPGDPNTLDCKYRGVLDVSPGVSDAIGLDGLGHVRIRWLRLTRR